MMVWVNLPYFELLVPCLISFDCIYFNLWCSTAGCRFLSHLQFIVQRHLLNKCYLCLFVVFTFVWYELFVPLWSRSWHRQATKSPKTSSSSMNLWFQQSYLLTQIYFVSDVCCVKHLSFQYSINVNVIVNIANIIPVHLSRFEHCEHRLANIERVPPVVIFHLLGWNHVQSFMLHKFWKMFWYIFSEYMSTSSNMSCFYYKHIFSQFLVVCLIFIAALQSIFGRIILPIYIYTYM